VFVCIVNLKLFSKTNKEKKACMMKHLIQIAMIMFLHMICFPNPTYSFWRFRSAL